MTKPKQPRIFNSFLIGVLPLLILVLVTNIIDDDTLTPAVIKFMSLIPEKHIEETEVVLNTRKSKKSKEERHKKDDPSVNRRDGANDHIDNFNRNKNKGQDYPRTQNKKVHSDVTATRDGKAHTIDENIDKLRIKYENDTDNIYNALRLAEALRHRDLIIHDGGSLQKEAINTYTTAIKLIKKQRDSVISSGGDIRLSKIGRLEHSVEEMFLSNEDKSIQILLVSTLTNLGKQYFMANMFEKAVEAYNEALELEEEYLDAINSRGSALFILGKYEEAGNDYVKVLSIDQGNLFTDVFTGLTKVFIAKKGVVQKGWDEMVTILREKIPNQEKVMATLRGDSPDSVQNRQILSNKLKVMHLAMYSYHDNETQDVEKGWYHLQAAHNYKLSVLPPYNNFLEQRKVQTLTQVFQEGFWPHGVGTSSRTPIFIIGFPRSGSTLLERVLDSHSQIAGTGEDSIFNGMLNEIRNDIVKASTSQSSKSIQAVVQKHAKRVNSLTRERWIGIERNVHNKTKIHNIPKRFVDKMLMNYYNVGFIHLLFPDALILHVIREPMDTLFSAYKHDFPPGNLDYTSDFTSLAHMYANYRKIMDHWDKVLPGRVTHVRYEDMVNDMPAFARATISATGLNWEDDVLNFHKKKQAVNTLSTGQVRKGVYKDSMQSWKRYKNHLQPLVDMMGSYVQHSFETTLDSFNQME